MAVFDQGMDVLAVAASGGKLISHQVKMMMTIGQVDGIIGGLKADWGGLDQAAFERNWHSHRNDLTAVARDIGTMGMKCLTNAQQQFVASS